MAVSSAKKQPDSLIRYTAACDALTKARTTDEVRGIRNRAAALHAYARIAKNRQLEIDAAEIRIRAERRLGEMIHEQKTTVGLAKGGKPYTKKKATGGNKPPVPTLAEVGIDKDLAKRSRRLAAIPPKQFEQRVEEWRARAENEKDRVTSTLTSKSGSVHHKSESGEHYTPQELLASVVEVLGTIDLDPCSNTGKPNVPARHHYTKADDGLTQPWSGRVFMNPPYGHEITAWIEKLLREWRSSLITEAIALLPSRTDTEWFDVLTGVSDDAVFCFLHGRLTFIGNDDDAPFPSMVMYLGPHHDRFARVFHELGSLWCRPSRPLEWFINHGEENEHVSA